jgi:hypothetical protein
MTIYGAIWYQGESNEDDPFDMVDPAGLPMQRSVFSFFFVFSHNLARPKSAICCSTHLYFPCPGFADFEVGTLSCTASVHLVVGQDRPLSSAQCVLLEQADLEQPPPLVAMGKVYSSQMYCPSQAKIIARMK